MFMDAYRQIFDFHKRFMPARILALGFLTLAASSTAWSQMEPKIAGKSESFVYSLDAGFSLLQEIKKPGTGDDNALKTTHKMTQPRTLGLSLFKLSADLHSQYGSGVAFVLRPDVTIYSQNPNRDVDFRSGQPYRKAPSLKLLDQYQIYIDPIEQMKIHFGVFDQLNFNRTSYFDVIGFTGEVILPRKFSAVFINWGECSNIPTVSKPTPSCDLSYDLFVFQGDDDRAETHLPSDKTFDSAPTANDPYQGLAGRIFWQKHFFSTGILLSFINRAEVDAKIARQSLQSITNFTYDIWSLSQRTSFDLRYEKETFTSDVNSLEDLAQNSLELSHAFDVNNESAVLAAFRYGTSERRDGILKKNQFKFRQIEIGLQHIIHKDLKISALATSEIHSVASDAETVGALVASDGSRRSNLSRFLLDLRYSK